MDAKVDTRFGTEDDADEIYDLVHAAYGKDSTGPAEDDPCSNIDALEDSLCAEGSRWLVCETPEGKMVACLHLELEQPQRLAWFRTLAVHPSSQRKGLGTLLLRRAEAVVRNLGCNDVEVEAWASDEGVSTFLEKVRYKESGGGMTENGSGVSARYVVYKKSLHAEGTNVEEKELETPAKSPAEDDLVSRIAADANLMTDVMKTLEGLGFVDEEDVNDLSERFANGTRFQVDDEDDGDDSDSSEEESDEGRKRDANKYTYNDNDDDDDGTSVEHLVTKLFQRLKTNEGRSDFEKLVREQDDQDNARPAEAVTD